MSQEQMPECRGKRDPYRAFTYFGLHPACGGYVARVLAPRADAVFFVGDCNAWSESDPMTRVENGVFECFIAADRIRTGSLYKFKIKYGGREYYKADPYAFFSELAPGTASALFDCGGYTWHDEGWCRHRARYMSPKYRDRRPLNIYELHLGSFKRHADGSPYTYRELAQELPTYVKAMGYTHAALLPITEHLREDACGAHVTGFFAPTSRYGTPHDFMALVDAFHEAGVGVILDVVCAHFSKEEHGLCAFDGAPFYEYEAPSRMEFLGRGTRFFDLGRPEVQEFLLSNAFFWIEQYHVDGLRLDDLAPMLFLDHDREPGEWTPNEQGDNRNLAAIAFLQKLTAHLRATHPDVLVIAEDTSGSAGITHDEDGGLGFSYKWNLAWTDDVLDYHAVLPPLRPYRHGKINFSPTYSFDERYILPISHEELMPGRGSLLGRTSGEYEQRFATTRALLAYMMTHPGKKQLFMGCEIGQFEEWRADRALDWALLDFEKHAAFQHFTAALNHFYLTAPALYERDTDRAGFAWIDADNAAQSILSYRRIDRRGHELVVIVNFGLAQHEGFCQGLPIHGEWEEVFNTDLAEYGGRGACNAGPIVTEATPLCGQPCSAQITVPSLGAVILRCKRHYRNPTAASPFPADADAPQVYQYSDGRT